VSATDRLSPHGVGSGGLPYFIQLWGAELWDAALAAEVNALDVKLLAAATRTSIGA